MSPYAGKKALLLGSGFVATPTVEVLSKAGVHVTVACRTLAAAQKLAGGFPNTTAISVDVKDAAALEQAVSEHDVAISLIPYIFHADVIKAAIKAKKNVVTTSYVSPAMLELDAAAKEAGITVMNEIGLDPGIDHLYAVKTIEEVHAEGGEVKGFWSYCGGLAAPECSDNPLGYKFSWSSRGVLLALKNEAKYIDQGKEIHVSSEELMATAKPYYTGYIGYNFVAYPNRDSTPYRQRYNMPECDGLVRGTLRYDGFPQFIKVLVDIGLLLADERDYLDPKDTTPLTWKDFLAKVLNTSATGENDLLWAIESKTAFPDTAAKQKAVEGLRWIGAFSDTPVTKRGTPLDTLCATLEEKMQFEEGERDLVFLQHRFDIVWKGGKKETRTSTLVDYGDPKGYSAMAKLVGVPCGVAVLQVLDGRINRKGILAPMDSELNNPIMKELKDNYGIEMIEKTV